MTFVEGIKQIGLQFWNEIDAEPMLDPIDQLFTENYVNYSLLGEHRKNDADMTYLIFPNFTNSSVSVDEIVASGDLLGLRTSIFDEKTNGIKRMSQHPSGPPTERRWDTNGREEWIQVNQARCDRESIDDLVTTVTSIVAEVKGVDPLDFQALPIMYESVDLQSLENTCCESEPTHVHRTEAEDVHFFYAGYNIQVGTDGWVTVYEKH